MKTFLKGIKNKFSQRTELFTEFYYDAQFVAQHNVGSLNDKDSMLGRIMILMHALEKECRLVLLQENLVKTKQ